MTGINKAVAPLGVAGKSILNDTPPNAKPTFQQLPDVTYVLGQYT